MFLTYQPLFMQWNVTIFACNIISKEFVYIKSGSLQRFNFLLVKLSIVINKFSMFLLTHENKLNMFSLFKFKRSRVIIVYNSYGSNVLRWTNFLHLWHLSIRIQSSFEAVDNLLLNPKMSYIEFLWWSLINTYFTIIV